MSTLRAERQLVSAEIAAEVTEIVCELMDLEHFELTATSPLSRYQSGSREPAEEIAATLECAFGVTFDRAAVARMGTLESVCLALEAALRSKRLTAR
ncbi:MAG: hypothetical protein AVDCRST_MAG75-1689 [uncultured Propionibacteriaceae bacterium]|uniref:Carrier domain-containing protein n=1 Tax=uncultured Propionibacteriaceae bacterium TaxID=257457 RepID=A0A6J4NPD0_9ACTN|nr:MAG: hypothetical protein AVDCRST_MAG75-1689 [uncultured Propionibacteriaceae bacterium]